jgi:hypothetical protein
MLALNISRQSTWLGVRTLYNNAHSRGESAFDKRWLTRGFVRISHFGMFTANICIHMKRYLVCALLAAALTLNAEAKPEDKDKDKDKDKDNNGPVV